MKRNILARRAASAALAACMMFTLSAPALAESTDALPQQSTAAKSAVSVLDAENSGTDANASVATKYGITIEITGRGKVEVDSSNCNNILGFLKYDPDKEKLTLRDPSAGAVNYLTIDAPNTDVVLESTEMIVNFNLLIENARSVKVSSNSHWAPVYGTVYIYCACPVTLEHTSAGANSGVAISGIKFAAPVSASDFVYYTSEAPDATPTDAGTGTIPATMVNYLRIAPKMRYNINTAKDATIKLQGQSTELKTAFAGEEVTVTAAGRENAVFTSWTAEGITLTDKQKVDPTVTFTMPAGNVTLTADYKQLYDLTVNGGTIVDENGDTGASKKIVKPGQPVTVKANAPTDEDAAKGVKFHHWKVEEGSTAFTLTDGKLGSKEEAGTEEISFDMPNGNVKLTAVYSVPASVLRSTVTVTGGTAKSTLGEGSDIPAEIGTEVKITADVEEHPDEEHPDKVFEKWEIVYPENFPENVPEELQLKLDNAKSATTTFEMPVYPVKLIAHWSASAVAGPDEPFDPDFGYDASSAAGGAIAAVAVGGAAIWGGYEIATRVILNDLLPEGAAIPANRGQLALLVWNTAGRPEPAGAPAFADVADPDMAKAAQWCTEQGTMDAKGDCFEPEGWTPKFKVIEVWNKAFPKQ